MTMDIAQIALFIIIIVLAILFIALGIQVFFILREFRKTVSKANKVLDNTSTITESISNPLSTLPGITAGIKAGMSIFSAFRKIIKGDESKKEKKEENGK